jgi:hypothetical protein
LMSLALTLVGLASSSLADIGACRDTKQPSNESEALDRGAIAAEIRVTTFGCLGRRQTRSCGRPSRAARSWVGPSPGCSLHARPAADGPDPGRRFPTRSSPGPGLPGDRRGSPPGVSGDTGPQPDRSGDPAAIMGTVSGSGQAKRGQRTPGQGQSEKVHPSGRWSHHLTMGDRREIRIVPRKDPAPEADPGELPCHDPIPDPASDPPGISARQHPNVLALAILYGFIVSSRYRRGGRVRAGPANWAPLRAQTKERRFQRVRS